MRSTVFTIAVAAGSLIAAHAATAQSSGTAPSSSSSGSMSSGGMTTGPSRSSSASSAGMVNMSAPEFAKTMANSDMFELESSNLALDRAKSTDVKSFARQMVQDHTQSTQKLKDAVKKSSTKIELPTTLDEKHTQLLQQLRKASGSDFDRAYMSQQLTAHQDAVQLLKSYSQNGDNPELKQVASQVLPTVEQHLTHAERIGSAESASK